MTTFFLLKVRKFEMIFLSRNFFQKVTNKFDFTTCRLVFVRFLEESEDTKKTFLN